MTADDEAAELHRRAAAALAAGLPLAAVGPAPPAKPRAKGLVCGRCGSPLRVVYARPAAHGILRRRRACTACTWRASTEERFTSRG